jgi:hypothetical protein
MLLIFLSFEDKGWQNCPIFLLKQQGENCDFSGINFCPRKILAFSRLRHSAAL